MATRDENGGNRPASAEHLLGGHELEHLNTLLRACTGATQLEQCWIAYLLGAAAVARVQGVPKPPGLDPILQRAIERGTMSEAQAREINALAERLVELGRGALLGPDLDPAAIERLACNGEKY
jgi:hypothetical protein